MQKVNKGGMEAIATIMQLYHNRFSCSGYVGPNCETKEIKIPPGFQIIPGTGKIHCLNKENCKGIKNIKIDQPCSTPGTCKNGGKCYIVIF